MKNLANNLIAKRNNIVARFDVIREQLETLDFEPELVDNPRAERINLDKQLADTIAQAERFNKFVRDTDIDLATICFVCCKCGAYANDRQSDGTCDCDNGCGHVAFDMIVL